MRRRRCAPPLRLVLAAALVALAAAGRARRHRATPLWGVAAALPSRRPPGADGSPPPAGWSRPPRLATRPDGTYGTPTRRLTDSAATNEFTPILRAGLQVEHSGGGWVLLDTPAEAARDKAFGVFQRADGRPREPRLDPRGAAPHWAAAGGPPAVAFFVGDLSAGSSESLELRTVDVASGAVAGLARPTSTVIDGFSKPVGGVGLALFSTHRNAYLRHWFGTYPSRNGRRYAWWTDQGPTSNTGGVAVMDLGPAPPTLLGTLLAWPPSRGRILGARITPSGGAVLVHFQAAGVFVYDTALTTGRRVMATRLLDDDAADVMVAAGSGHDTLVAINDEEGTEDGGWVVAVDLVTLGRAPLFPLPRDGGARGGRPRVTVSGQAYNRPGWVVLSADPCDAGADGDWLCGKVVAMEVASRRVVPLAHTHACGARRENPGAAASPNVDLSRVYFASASGRCRGEMELFELTTAGRLGTTPPPDGLPAAACVAFANADA